MSQIVLNYLMVSFLELGSLFCMREFMDISIDFLPSGPFFVFMPLLVNYFLDIPNANTTRFLGFPVTGKTLTYIMAFQLASTSRGSMVSAFCCLISGVITRCNFLGITENFKIPKSWSNLVHSTFGWLLESEGPHEGQYEMGATLEIQRQQQAELYEQQMLLNMATQRIPNFATLPRNPRDQNGIIGGGAVNRQPAMERNPPATVADDASVEMLVEMGFNRASAIRALQRSNNDIPTATNMLLSENS